MAEVSNRFGDNVGGRWYVDSNCIVCGLCGEYAPSVFRLSEEGDHNYVFHQPESPAELEDAVRAKEACPTDSIGNDGGVGE